MGYPANGVEGGSSEGAGRTATTPERPKPCAADTTRPSASSAAARSTAIRSSRCGSEANSREVSRAVSRISWARSHHLSKKLTEYKEDSWISEFAVSIPFEYTTLCVIAANAVWMGVESDLNRADSLQETDLVWIVGENIFCSYFLIEILIRFVAFREKLHCLRDGWFVFDSALVALMVFETWIMYAFSNDGSGPDLDLGFLRLLRLARLSRLAHVLHQVPELLTMVKGIFAATRSVGSVLLLLLIFCYVFAIVFTGNYRPVAGKTYSEEDIYLQDYFGNLGQSMFTLFVNGTLLDDLADLIKAIREDSVLMLLAFLLFILLSSFTVLNMLIGILCDVVADTEKEEVQRRKVDVVREVLTDQFNLIDKDSSGMISHREFDEMCQDEQVLNTIEGQLGIDRTQLRQLQALIFRECSNTTKTEGLTFEEFLVHLIRLRPDEHASPMDIQQFRKVLREQETSVLRNVTSLRKQMEVLRSRMQPTGIQRVERPATAAAESQASAPGDLCWAQPRCESRCGDDEIAQLPVSVSAAEAHARLVAGASDFELVEELKRRLPAGAAPSWLE